MIRELCVELQAALRATTIACPIPVVERERTKPAGYIPERIVLEHDDDAGDKFSAPRSQRYNPRHAYTCTQGAKATIYVKAAAANATEFEHRRRAEKVRDQVLAAMRTIAGTRKNAFVPVSGRHFVPEGLDGPTRGGAAYEIKFTFERAVQHRKWDGSAKSTAVLARVAMAGAPTLTFANVGATGDTITRSGGSWVTDGFVAGMRVRVRGTTSNNISDAEISTVTASTLTFGATALTNEVVAGAAVTAGGLVTAGWVAFGDDDNDPTTVPSGAEAI